MPASRSAAAPESDRAIEISRVIDAPRERVFDAFTDAGHISLWWGPRGFTTTTHSMDVRPGGVWRFIMHGPDGTDYGNRITYTEVVRPERLAYEHDTGEHNDPGLFHATITFDAVGKRTRLTLRMVFATVEQYEGMKEFGAVEGGEQTLERLGEYIAKAE